MTGIRSTNPRKNADTLQKLFSGVGFNNIEYLVERETGFEPFSLSSNNPNIQDLTFHSCDCRHFAESIVLTVACRCTFRNLLVSPF